MDTVANAFIALLISTNGILPNTHIYRVADFVEAARSANMTCQFNISLVNSLRTVPISTNNGEYADHGKYNTRIANAIVTEIHCTKTTIGDVYTLVARPVA